MTATARRDSTTLFHRNKQVYVEEENKLETIIADNSFLQTFQSWLDTMIAQLDYQFERCEQQLAELQQSVSVQGGSFWCSKTIIEHCNLHLSEKRLVTKGQELDGDQHAPLPDLIHLISTLQQTKSHSFMTPKQRELVEQIEEELKHAVLEPRDLRFITNALQTKLRDEGNTRGVFGDLTSFQNTIEELSPDVDQCEQLLEASIANGEMSLAEEISRRQLEIYEHILRLITDQYPVISNYYTESRNSDRRRRWAIFRMADRDITTVVESKHRQVEACEEDLLKIREQLENYNNDDAQQRKRYELDRGDSDLFLQQNKEKQQGVWNRVFGIFQELQTCVGDLTSLARQRRKEVERRLQMEEREAGRRSGHDAFKNAASEHAQRLQDTIDNANTAREIAEALNNFVLDGCDSITAKYDKQQNALSDTLRVVQQHHFKRFSDYYIAASRFLYRKERRLAQIEEDMKTNDMQRELKAESLDPSAKQFAEANEVLALKRREVAQEVLHIRHKLEKAEKAVEPTLRSLHIAGVDYVHPRDISEKMNLNRWSTVLDYRELVQPSFTQMQRQQKEEQAVLDHLRTTIQSQTRRSLRAATTGIRGTTATSSTSTLNRPGHAAAAPSSSSSTAAAAAGMSAGVQASANATTATARAPPQSAFAKRIQAMLEKQLQYLAPDGVNVAATAPAGLTSSTSRGLAAAPAAQRYHLSATATTLGPEPTKTHGSAAAGMGSSAAAPVSSTWSPGAGGVVTAGTTVAAAETAAAAASDHIEGSTLRALYTYKARAPDELSFDEGDLIVCVNRAPEEGWFKGVCNQRTGLFPINYVEPHTGGV